MATTLRQIIRELRRIHGKGSVRSSPMYIYVMEQYRHYQLTGAKYCKDQNEMKHLAQTYGCLLENTRKREEVNAIYSRGERSIEESANLVGLALPKVKSFLEKNIDEIEV